MFKILYFIDFYGRKMLVFSEIRHFHQKRKMVRGPKAKIAHIDKGFWRVD
jgi:hypothetical protein